MKVRSATASTGMRTAGRVRSLALLAALGAVVLTGCDGDEGGEAAPPPTPTADTDGDGDIDADDQAPDASAESGQPEAPGEPVPPPTEPADIEIEVGERGASQDGRTVSVQGEGAVAAFVTPSGNIACVVNGASATCQVLDKTYTPPGNQLVASTVGECGASQADAMMLTDEQGAWTCPPEALTPIASVERGGWWEPEVEGDTIEVDGVRTAVLPYGESIEVGATTCSSSDDGVSCTNSDLGRQFFLARTAYRYG